MPVLEAENVRKRFGGVVALDGGAVAVEPGEVHFLMGSNGSGKSTLCKVIAGVVAPDHGSVLLDGEPLRVAGPREARAHRIAVVYQELSLIPRMSVARNIMLGIEPRGRFGLVDLPRLHDEAARAAETFSSVVGPGFRMDMPVDRLPPDEQQIVEILKALATDPRIIIFDEATSSLHREQVKVLFDVVRDLKARGRSVIFISHRMEEVFEVGDRATVLRNGQTVGTLRLAEAGKDDIVRMMVGHEPAAPGARAATTRATDEMMRVEGLASERLRDVSFVLRAGEILGLGGLHGQGQSDLLLCLFGALPAAAGTVEVAGRVVASQTPRGAMKRAMAYISGDRARHGVLAIRPVLENMALCHLQKANRLAFRRSRLARDVLPTVERLRMVLGGLDSPVKELSGGNQQKVVIGKWLMTEPKVVLMDDPTKGIDVHTKEELYGLVRAMCDEGAAVVWHSSEDAELLSNADRILVFNEGRIVDELSGERLSELELCAAAMKTARETTGADGAS